MIFLAFINYMKICVFLFEPPFPLKSILLAIYLFLHLDKLMLGLEI